MTDSEDHRSRASVIHNFRLPLDVSDLLRKSAEEKGVNMTDVLVGLITALAETDTFLAKREASLARQLEEVRTARTRIVEERQAKENEAKRAIEQQEAAEREARLATIRAIIKRGDLMTNAFRLKYLEPPLVEDLLRWVDELPDDWQAPVKDYGEMIDKAFVREWVETKGKLRRKDDSSLQRPSPVSLQNVKKDGD